MEKKQRPMYKRGIEPWSEPCHLKTEYVRGLPHHSWLWLESVNLNSKTLSSRNNREKLQSHSHLYVLSDVLSDSNSGAERKSCVD